MRQRSTKKGWRSCSAAIILAAASTQAAGGDADPTGRLAVDRIASATAGAIAPGGQIVRDIYTNYHKTRQEYNPDATAISLAVGRYNRSLGESGLELNIYRGASLLRDTGLAIGGAPGIAAAGLLRVTVDRMVEDIYAQRHAAYATLLQEATRTMTTEQLAELQKEAKAGRPSGTFSKNIQGILDAGGMTDDQGRQATQRAVLDLVVRMSESNLIENSRVAQDQAGTKVAVSQAIRSLKELDTKTEDLQTQLKAVSASSQRALDGIDDLRYASLKTPAEQAEYLLKGGLAHVDPAKRREMLDSAQRQARYDAVQTAIGDTAQAMNALSTFTRNILHDENAAAAMQQVSTGLQLAQSAMTIAGAFAGTASPLVAINALGAISGVFGGGSDPLAGMRVELEAIRKQLVEVNKRLDEVIGLQRETLLSLEAVNRKLDKLEEDNQDLKYAAAEHVAAVLGAQWKGVYGSCQYLVARFQGGGGGGFELPYLSSDAYAKAHFLDLQRLALLNSPDGNACAEGLRDLIMNPDQIRLLSFRDKGKARSGVEHAQSELDDARRALEALLSQRYGNTDQVAIALRAALLYMTSPAENLDDLQARADAFDGGPIADNRLPCWWRNEPNSNGPSCEWATPRARHDGVSVYDDMLDGASKDSLLHPWAVAELDDYALTFYPQRLVRGVNVGNPAALAGSNVAAFAREKYPAVQQDLRDLLMGYLQVTDVAVAQQAMSNGGDLLAAFLARNLLEPPIIDGKLVPSLQAGVPRECLKKWGNSPAAVTAPTQTYLREHPRTALLVLQLIARNAAFPPGASAIGSAARYEAARITEPTGKALDASLHWAPTPEASATERGAWNAWWEGIFELDQKTVLRQEAPAPGPSRSIPYYSPQPLAGLELLKGHGYELVYAATDGVEIEIWTAQKRSQADKDDPLCGTYEVKPEKVKLPRGWSLSAGGLVMALPSASQLQVGPIAFTSEQSALLTRQASLRQELASLAVMPDIRGIEAPMAYGLAQQARVALKIQDHQPGVLLGNSK